MILKWLFDRVAAAIALLVQWPVLVVVAIMIKVKMPGGPAVFVQKRVGKDGKLFNCHKFRTMTMNHDGSTISVAGDRRITPFGKCSICPLLGYIEHFYATISTYNETNRTFMLLTFHF